MERKPRNTGRAARPLARVGAHDGPAHLIFLIGAPSGSDDAHLHILAALARKIVHEDFRQMLRDADSPKVIADIIKREVTL
jgi:PTS system fructose-specific IIA component